MNNDEIPNYAYSEVIYILGFIDRKDYEKIPLELIEFFEDSSNPNFTVEYDPKISLNEQNISEEAKAIISVLYREYWASEDEKQELLKKDEVLFDNDDSLKTGFDISVFNKKVDYGIKNSEMSNIQLPIKAKKTFFRKVINKILKLFKR